MLPIPMRRSYTEACRLEHPRQQNIPGRWALFERLGQTSVAAGRGKTANVTEAEHDEHVTDMNEVHRCASGWVQRAASKVAAMIDEPGHPTGHPAIPR
jgi:hypothetical protein